MIKALSRLGLQGKLPSPKKEYILNLKRVTIKKKSCMSEVSLCWSLLVYVHIYWYASNNFTFFLGLTFQAGMPNRRGAIHPAQFSV